MLKAEQAEKTLKKLEEKEWAASRIARARLTGRTRDLLLAFDETERDRREFEAWEQRLRTALGESGPAERAAVFEALFPGRGAVVERGWQLHRRLPYQVGWDRKAFRAPGRDDVLLRRRADWVSFASLLLGPYEQPLPWLAAWGPHIRSDWHFPDVLGILLAAAMDEGGREGDEVLEVLRASARSDHDVGTMGRHVTRALLTAARPDGWDFVEKMLLAAQREEGLRQVILETVDEAHPDAFRRMLRLIVDHGLVRFSSVVRALNLWVGYQWDAVSAGVVNRTIETLLRFLDNAPEREAALHGDDAEAVYLALWATAYDDATAAVGPALALLEHPAAEHRYVATHLLSLVRLPEADHGVMRALDDADLRVAYRAVCHWRFSAEIMTYDDGLVRRSVARARGTDLFERLERQVERYPAKRAETTPIVWPWTGTTIAREYIAETLPLVLGDRSPTRLVPWLGAMDPWKRVHAVALLGTAFSQRGDAAARASLLRMAGDASQHVRGQAMAGLGDTAIAASEAPGLEALLSRSAGDIRSNALALLMRQPDADALASADRLLASRDARQRLGGLELLRRLSEAGRTAGECRTRVGAYRARAHLTAAEEQALASVPGAGEATLTLADALGLARASERTWAPAPVGREVTFHTEVTQRIVRALDKALREHAEDIVTAQRWDGSTYTGPFGSWNMGTPNAGAPVATDRDRFTLGEIWEKWWLERGPELRDPDGMELPRALVALQVGGSYDDISRQWLLKMFPDGCAAILGPTGALGAKEKNNVRAVLSWMVKLHPPEGAVDFILDAAEASLARVDPGWCVVTEADLEKKKNYYKVSGANPPASLEWRFRSPFVLWLKVADAFREHAPQAWTPAQWVRLWHQWRWMDEPRWPVSAGGEALPSGAMTLPRHAPPLGVLCRAREAGGATDADVYDLLLGERSEDGNRHYFLGLQYLTRPRAPELARDPSLRPLVERSLERIVEVEMGRGDTPTAASQAALEVRAIFGADMLVRLLGGLGARSFRRGYHFDSLSIETVFSHLVRRCLPREGDTPEAFARLMAAAKIPDGRIVELAVYAPQWAPFVEHMLNWDGLAEGVWWIHAHTKGNDWHVDSEIRDLWKADVSARTPLDAQDLLDGAVDVAWFHRVHGALGSKRWQQLYEAAKYACSGAGHARARLFADAMLAEVTKKELVALIRGKRNQDAVRSIGLLPLAAGAKRESDVLVRYHIVQEFVRGSRQFGSQRQASEKRAAQVGLDNLARTAGYADPIRLQWAMEAKAVEDLAEGPITVKVEGVELSLGIDPWGDVDLKVTKDGKPLSDVPAKLKKHKQVARLRQRKVELKRQASRIRPSLEQLMIRGDTLTGAELKGLLEHPLLGPMLKGLVLVGEGATGYPVPGGKSLEDHAGRLHVIKAKDSLRIAHPLDLLPAASWARWQKDCFARERIQPFKQVFRELYPLTANERKEADRTSRYASHQVQPRRALALLGGRGWVSHPEEGVRKTFHDAGLVAWLEFEEGSFTPAEVEGLTLDTVRFTRRADGAAVKLKDVPPRLFSEAMRDLDLVVSVAHRGGVDPEASASTVEMRAALVEQAAALLELGNVRVKAPVVLVDGELGRYTVHLGSAVTRKLPGETLFIVAVHSQHRGRLFLPFADDDPRSAEVLSKVLLLARDRQIKDPTILEQLRG